jgi:hypothetical protein
MLVEPVEQRLETEVDHERFDMEHGGDDLLLKDTAYFSADLLAHTSEWRQYNPAVVQPQMPIVLRHKLVDSVA